MTLLLYNKPLLRVLAVLCGAGIGLAAWYYVALSATKLPEQGARDALAIISFLISGWLMMLIAEVVDNHYLRVFGCLCAGLGGYVSFPWIFRIDGPKLAELPSGKNGMQMVGLGFWAAMALAAIMLVLLVWRLIYDRLTYGRPAFKAAKAEVSLGPAPAGAGQPAGPTPLPPIPIDTSPIAVAGSTGTQAVAAVATPARTAAPVKRLTGIGGLYMGTTFELSPGEHVMGRQDAEFLLSSDNQVSRRHAHLSVSEQGLCTLTDLNSTNGTFVNNERISTLALCPGDVVRIGTSLFKVEA
jgi:hypothetical protein